MSMIIQSRIARASVQARTWHVPLLVMGILFAGCSHAGQGGSPAVTASAFQADGKASVMPAASLPAPTGLTVTGTGATQVSLSWTASSGASDYYVFYGTTSGGETTKSPAIVGTSATISGLNEATTYYFVVEAYSHASGTTSAASNEVSATTATTLPAPAGLQATVAGAGQVALTWSASSGASDYYVYYGTASGEETTKSAAILGTSTTIAGLNGATTYYFVVKAYNHTSGVTSPASNEVSAITPLAAPGNLNATPGNAQVNLSWTGSPGASDYYVFSTPAGGATTKSAPIVSTSTTITGLTNGTVYSFYVEAYNHPNAITSPASNPVNATPSSGGSSSSSSGGASSSSSSSSGASSSSSSSSSSSGGASSSSSSSSGGSTSSGGSGSTIPNYLLAYAAYPTQNGGKTGLYVVPSQALNTPLQPVGTNAINLDTSTEVIQTLTDNQGQAIAQIPYGLVYAGTSGSGSTESTSLFRLDLSSTSDKVPVQLTNFAPGSDQKACQFALSDYTNLNQPSSAYFVLQIAMENQEGDLVCWDYGTPSPGYPQQYLLINYGASATTSPQALPLGSSDLVTFHDLNSGALTGIAGIDTKGNLNFYSDITFSSPRLLLANVSSFQIVSASPSYAFLDVLSTSAVANNSAAGSLFRVDGTGTISADLYDYQACSTANCYNGRFSGLPTPDGTSLFFADNVTTIDETTSYTTGYTDILAKVALNGSSAAQKIYTASGGAPPFPGGGGIAAEAVINLAGFVNSTLIFDVQSYSSGYPATLETIPQTAAPNTTPTIIASIPDGFFGANFVTDGQVFINEHNYDINSGDATGNNVAAIAPDGTVAYSISNAYLAITQDSVSGSPVDPTFTISSIVMFTNYVETDNIPTVTLNSLSPVNFNVTPFESGNTPYTYTANSNNVPIFFQSFYFDPIGAVGIPFGTDGEYSEPAAIDFVNNTFQQLSNDRTTSYVPLVY